VFRYDVYGIIGVKSNIPILPSYLKRKKLQHVDLIIKKGKIKFKIKKNEEYFLTKTLKERVYAINDGIYVEQKIKGITLSRFFLKDLEGKTFLVFEERIPRILISKLPSSLFHVKQLIEPLIQLKLLQKNHTLIHAGVVVDEEKRAYALAGWSQVGKSTTIFELKNLGLKVLSDSLPILSPNGKIYSIGEKGEFVDESGKRIFFDYTTHEGKLHKLFVLMKSSKVFVRKVNYKEILNKLVVSLHKGIESVLSRRVFLLYSYVYDYPFIANLDFKIVKILKRALKPIDCFIVGGSRRNFYKTIYTLIKDEDWYCNR